MNAHPSPPRADPLPGKRLSAGRPVAEAHPLAHHHTYWLRVAEEERANGYPGLADDYIRLAEHAERICQMLCVVPCQEMVL